MSPPAPVTCPRCASANTIGISYGLPGAGLMEAAERGEVVLGGCCIEAGQPSHKCKDCGAGFANDERPRG